MANKTAILSIRVVSDTKQAQSGLSQVDQSVRGVDSTVRRLAETQALQRVGDSLLELGRLSVDAASRAEQAAGAVRSVFGDMAADVEKAAGMAATAVGLSSSQYSELASVLGAQLKNLGTPVDQLAGQTDQLITLGADLAATFGGTTADAVGALSALLRGERDPIERYGVTIKQASIDAWLAANGFDGLTGSARTAAEAQATMALLLEQTAAAQGQFTRETDTYAVQQQIANAQIDDALAKLGEVFLPIMQTAAGLLAQFAQWCSENATLVQILAVVIGAFTVAIIAMNVAMLANPMTLIIAGIMAAVTALIAGIWLLAKNWDAVWSWLSDVWRGFVDGITAGIDAVIGWIDEAIGWFRSLFSWGQRTSGMTVQASMQTAVADRASIGVGSMITAARLTATATPSAAAIRAAAGSAGAHNVTIVLPGVLDTRSAAREIRKVLTDDSLLSGRRRPGAVVTW